MHPRAQQIIDLTDGWRTDAEAEAQVIEILRSAPPEELDDVLADLDVDDLIGDVDNHVWGPDNRPSS